MRTLIAATAFAVWLEPQLVFAQSNSAVAGSPDGRWHYVFEAGPATAEECGRIVDGHLDVVDGKTSFHLYHPRGGFRYSDTFDEQNHLKSHAFSTWGEADITMVLSSNYGVGYLYYAGPISCHGRIVLEKGAAVSSHAREFADQTEQNRSAAEKRCIQLNYFPASRAFDRCVAK